MQGRGLVSHELGCSCPHSDSQGERRSVKGLCPLLPAHLSSPVSALPAPSVPALKALFVAWPHHPIYSFLWLARVPMPRMCGGNLRTRCCAGSRPAGQLGEQASVLGRAGNCPEGLQLAQGGAAGPQAMGCTEEQERLGFFLGRPFPPRLRAGGVGEWVLGLHGDRGWGLEQEDIRPSVP